MIALLPILYMLAAQPASAPSEDKLADAKKYFDAGRQAYEAGDYQAAAAAFEESYQLVPKAAIVFSIAQAYRQQYFVDRDTAKLRRAIGLYTEYLKEVPKGGRRNDAIRNRADLEETLAVLEKSGAKGTNKPPPEAAPEGRTQLMISSRTPNAMVSIDGADPEEAPLIAEVKPGTHAIKVEADGYLKSELSGVAVEHRLVVVEVNLKPKPALIHVSAPEGSEVVLDGRPIGSAPLLRAIQTGSGEHFVAVTESGHHAFTKQVSLEKGQEISLVADLDSTVQRDVSYVFLGAGGVVFIGTGVALIVALTSEGQARLLLDKLNRGMNLTIRDRDNYNMYRNRRNDLVTASSIGVAGAGALGLLGGLLYFLDTPVVPSAGNGSIGVEVGGSF